MCRDMDCVHCRIYVPIRVFFEPLVAGNQKASLATLSAALPIQALRGLLCRGRSLLFGSLAHRGAPMGGRLMGQALCCSAANAGMSQGREAMGMAPPPMSDSAVLLLWLPGFPPPAFPTIVSPLTSPSISPQSTAALALGLLYNP